MSQWTYLVDTGPINGYSGNPGVVYNTTLGAWELMVATGMSVTQYDPPPPYGVNYLYPCFSNSTLNGTGCTTNIYNTVTAIYNPFTFICVQ
jgi:hypothetical protein